MTLLATALAYAHAGRAVFPVAPGTKVPSLPSVNGPHFLQWKAQYGAKPPDDTDLARWFTPDYLLGISIACGLTSGVWTDDTEYALEVIDIDDPQCWDDFMEAAHFSGLSLVLARLVLERTPRGSGHLGYLCATVQGNQVLARRQDANTGKVRTLIETRGEGGQIVAAPTPPGVHPEHPERGYVLLQGDWTAPPQITPDERQQLLDLARSFNEYVDTPQVVSGTLTAGVVGQRPGDVLNRQADGAWWHGLLTTHGWRLLAARNGIQYWQRPGKEGQGCSATLGACGPYFYAFSSNAAPFEPERAYSAFAAYTLLEHVGNFDASARALWEARRQAEEAATRDVPDMTRAEGPNEAPLGWQATPAPAARKPRRVLTIPGLKLSKGKEPEPLATIRNLLLVLRGHPAWQGRLWWDAVRYRAMLDTEEMDDDLLLGIAEWFEAELDMTLTGAHLSMLEKCVYKRCREDTRDLLRAWFMGLPPWDHQLRLDTWLHEIAGVTLNNYGRLVSRMLPLMMTARAMDPGCPTREVVILEGPEALGKTTLVLALAGGEAWHHVFSLGFDSKEVLMELQGAWVAELAELESLTRTTEPKLKSFITMAQDTWIPKWSNSKIVRKRRTVFIGTTNEHSYLKGQTGNTRYLPILTQGEIKIAQFQAMREQLFAEALWVYTMAPQAWWYRTGEEDSEAQKEREARRDVSIYEDPLSAWLDTGRFDVFQRHLTGTAPVRGETTWEEIAMGFLQLPTPERWSNMALQKDIAKALYALGWFRVVEKRDKKSCRFWRHASYTPVPF